MKRKWLYAGVGVSGLLQFIIDWIWFRLRYGDSTIVASRFSEADIPLSLLSNVAFALVVGFFYLHVLNEKRSLRAGTTIGAILGFLIGVYRWTDWLGNLNAPISVLALEIARTVFLGAMSGVIISYAELKTNRRGKIVG